MKTIHELTAVAPRVSENIVKEFLTKLEARITEAIVHKHRNTYCDVSDFTLKERKMILDSLKEAGYEAHLGTAYSQAKLDDEYRLNIYW